MPGEQQQRLTREANTNCPAFVSSQSVIASGDQKSLLRRDTGRAGMTPYTSSEAQYAATEIADASASTTELDLRPTTADGGMSALDLDGDRAGFDAPDYAGFFGKPFPTSAPATETRFVSFRRVLDVARGASGDRVDLGLARKLDSRGRPLRRNRPD